MWPFDISRDYSRDQLKSFVGSNQEISGVLWGKNERHTIICTTGGRHGARAGYEDRQLPDGSWHYFGQGTEGNQRIENTANRHLSNTLNTILLFQAREPTSHERRIYDSYGKRYRFLGPFTTGLVEDFIPKSGKRRGDRLLRFQIIPAHSSEGMYLEQKISPAPERDEQLRDSLTDQSNFSARQGFTVIEYRRRSDAVRIIALNRARGRCEGCDTLGPFRTDYGEHFLEVHHIHRLADFGPDIPVNVAALCPNCHRRAHLSEDRASFNTALSTIIKSKEDQLRLLREIE